jgi:predicted CXXCH cytochrome family protein
MVEAPGQVCGTCHSDIMEIGRLQHGHAPVAQGDCVSCHEPHQGKNDNLLKHKGGELCGTCHGDVLSRINSGDAHAPAAMGLCLTCHTSHGSEFEGMTRREGAALCSGCHAPEKPELAAKHPGMAMAEVNCVSCHDPHSQAKGSKGLMRPALHLPFAQGNCESCHTRTGSAELVSHGAELCLTCHADFESKIDRAHVHNPMTGGPECVACHNPHAGAAGPALKRDPATLCFQCHDRRLMAGSVQHAAMENGCLSCHDPHATDEVSLLKDKTETVCMTCHRDVTQHLHSTSSETAVDPRTNERFSCAGCHKPHGAERKSLLSHDPVRDLCVQCHGEGMMGGEGGE